MIDPAGTSGLGPEGGTCRNCEAPLAGPFCSRCGQRARGSARSMGTLLLEARDALVHLDGRLWRSLRALALRPGLLTLEYFRDRRASYVHPFRLYLAASLVFFSIAAAAALGGGRSAALDLSALPEAKRAEVARELDRAERELRADPTVPPAASRAVGGARKKLEKGEELLPDPSSCDGIEVDDPRFRTLLVEACKRNVADRGRGLWRAVATNIPRMMFVFLPLMALVMKVLYWRPRRYYVEHLVFFLHTHAAAFVLLALALSLRAVSRWAEVGQGAALLASVALWGYAAWYVWRALRTYYGQGRILTLAKAAVLFTAYLAFLSVTLVATVAFSALSS